MKSDAIAVANYFVDRANEEHCNITLLRLVKYVYIAYGFALALLNKSIIDHRFDKVEAWKYGPVIPNVYHSFKHNGDKPITQKVCIVTDENMNGDVIVETPEIKDENIRKVLDFVWKRYKDRPTSYLITLLHREDTPWAYCYRVGQNTDIPEEMTKVYYQSLVQAMAKNGAVG